LAKSVSPRSLDTVPDVESARLRDWEWPDELDALVAAPANHQVLLENERVRVIETVVPVREMTPVHTHRWASVEYVLSSTNFVRRDGNVLFDTRVAHAQPRPSDALWSEPFLPHSVENVGDAELRVIMVELKDDRQEPLLHCCSWRG
jgi:quercetin dioxygenase-like cupin family protein